MTRVHASALVDRAAQLDEGVEVGPFCVIGPKVRIGAGTRLAAHVVIDGDTVIGRDNQISPFCSLGGPPQDKKYAGEHTQLVIGDRNTIREYCYFNTGTVQDAGVTRIGNDNWIMGYVHVAHDCRIGDQVILANGTQLAGHVELGDWVILGGLTGVHQFVKVGAHAMAGAHSYLNQDVPPYVLCSGSPARPHGINSEGLKRRGFDADTVTAIRRAYRALYRQNLNLEAARVEIGVLRDGADSAAQAALDRFDTFLASATRGVIR